MHGLKERKREERGRGNVKRNSEGRKMEEKLGRENMGSGKRG